MLSFLNETFLACKYVNTLLRKKMKLMISIFRSLLHILVKNVFSMLNSDRNSVYQHDV